MDVTKRHTVATQVDRTSYHCRYTLHTGQRGTLTLAASDSCSAVTAALQTFGLSLRTCSARPAHPIQPQSAAA